MLIQILDKNHHVSSHLKLFKEICDALASKYEMKKLGWLNTEKIDLNCDVFFKSIDATRVLVGYFNNINPDDSIKEPHWVEIEIVGPTKFDAITQILLMTVGMIYIPSISGFSVDWEDIQTVLNNGSKGYCCAFDWEESQLVMEQTEERLSESMKITGSAMLLNQGLRLEETFKQVGNLVNNNTFSKDGLEILNITAQEELPLTNIFLFMGKETSPRFINMSHIYGTSSDKIKTLH